MMQFDELWDMGKPEETRQRFLPLLKSPNAEADVDYRAQLMTQIARTYSLQGEFAAAHHLLDDVEPLLDQTRHETKARYLLERGRAFNSAGEKGQARVLFLQALEAAEHAAVHNSVADYYVVDALHMMGIVELPEQQLDWSLKGLAFTEKSTDKKTKRWLGPLYNNIGWTYHDMGQYEKALEIFEKSVVYRAEQGEPRPLGIARWTVGRTLRSLERYEEAYRLQTELLHEYQQSGRVDGYVYEELAECGLALGLEDTGRAYARLAYQELSKDSWLVEHEGERLKRLKSLGQ